MNRKLFSVIILFVAAVLLLSLSNCARNQHLVSISIPLLRLPTAVPPLQALSKLRFR
jgi:hypothetical protein